MIKCANTGANMFFKNILRCTLAVAFATPLCVFADPLNVKVGAWEMTTTTLMTGMMVPVEAQAKMSSEQRAMIQEAMKAYAGKPTTDVSKACVTKEDLDQDRLLMSEDEDQCKKKIISKSATKIAFELTCAEPSPYKSTVIVEARTSEGVVGSMNMVQGDSSGKVHVDIKGRWLGSSCDGIEKGDSGD
jgi:hypothetical protein